MLSEEWSAYRLLFREYLTGREEVLFSLLTTYFTSLVPWQQRSFLLRLNAKQRLMYPPLWNIRTGGGWKHSKRKIVSTDLSSPNTTFLLKGNFSVVCSICVKYTGVYNGVCKIWSQELRKKNLGKLLISIMSRAVGYDIYFELMRFNCFYFSKSYPRSPNK